MLTDNKTNTTKSIITIKPIITSKSETNSICRLVKIMNGNYVRINSHFGKDNVKLALARGLTNTIKAN